MTRERLISLAVTTVQGQHPVGNAGLWPWLKGQLHFGPRPIPTEQSLVTVPPYSIVDPPLRHASERFDISYNYNVVKIIAAIAQIGYASLQLVETSGPQLERFGYAAYQLTVIPYAIMSVLNLLGSLCEPEFPTMFLVRRDTDATGDYSEISADVGTVCEPEEHSTLHRTRLKQVCPHS